MAIAQLPPDILIRVCEELLEDNCLHALYSCALVNHEFHSAASRLLYRSVTLAPAFTNTINLKRRSQELVSIYSTTGTRNLTDTWQNPQFTTACLPKNFAFVLELIISGERFVLVPPPSEDHLPMKTLRIPAFTPCAAQYFLSDCKRCDSAVDELVLLHPDTFHLPFRSF